MRTLQRRLAAVFAAGGVLLVVGEARAEHTSCDELLAARARGQSAAQITTAFHTTHARLVACEHITDKHQQLQQRRTSVEDARAERGWLHAN